MTPVNEGVSESQDVMLVIGIALFVKLLIRGYMHVVGPI